MKNLFLSSVKSLFFGASHASSANRYPHLQTESEKRLVPMLDKLQTLSALIPGGQFDIEIEEGRVLLLLRWKPRLSAQAGGGIGHHCFVVDETMGKEVESLGDVTVLQPVDIRKEQATPQQTALNVSRKSAPDTPQQATPEASQQAEKPSRTLGIIRQVSDFLTSRYYFRFNLLTEQTECAELDSDHYQKVDQRMLNTLSLDALEAGIDCWDRDVQRFVNSKKVAVYHPFTDYMKGLEKWDGKDRVKELAARVSDNSVWQEGFHRWMLAMTAQWMKLDMNGRANSVAPLLVSARQGWGKSTFCRLLMPEALSAYFTESFDLASPASAEQKLATFGLINIDEFDKISAAKLPLLKNLMQMTALNIRRAYHRSAEPLHRIASFIGTSNREDLLVDRTGSRRFLCVKLEHPIDCTTPVNHNQLYAQLKEELESGERYWFTKEEEEQIQRNNALFYKHIPEEEIFRSVFRFATDEEWNAYASAAANGTTKADTPEVLQLNASQIFEAMKLHSPAAMRGMTAYSLSRILPQLGERLHTMKGNVYRVVRV